MNKPKVILDKSKNKINESKTQLTIDEIIQHIGKLKSLTDQKGSLKDYKVRDLVTHSQFIGQHLQTHGLKTNQIRKFLDSIMRLKARIILGETFNDIEDDMILLEPKLAYAAARKRQEMRKSDNINPAKDLAGVLTSAIKQSRSQDDFDRLVQLVESIVAYHKAEGGKNQ